jgi:hypothetical protein
MNGLRPACRQAGATKMPQGTKAGIKKISCKHITGVALNQTMFAWKGGQPTNLKWNNNGSTIRLAAFALRALSHFKRE